jgi:hypothetical protein
MVKFGAKKANDRLPFFLFIPHIKSRRPQNKKGSLNGLPLSILILLVPTCLLRSAVLRHPN